MIVVSPTDPWIRKAFGGCKHSVRVSSPFVGAYLRDRVAELSAGISVTLLTRTLLSDFASSASDLEAVCAIAHRADAVLSLNSLHAKVYIVDESKALITSANATYSGMHRNAECGFELSSSAPVSELNDRFSEGFGARHIPKPWAAEELEGLRVPVQLLRDALPKMPRVPSAVDQPPRMDIRRSALRKLAEGFSGWLGLTFEGILAIGKPNFTIDEVWGACEPIIRERFPMNRFPRPKIRQQLQRLRDIGVLQFLGAGRYELLTRPAV